MSVCKGRCTVFYDAENTMTVDAELIALGGERLGAPFNQTEFDSTNSDRGYCAGIALDWTRRVLQSGKAIDEDYLSYSKQSGIGNERRDATEQRMHAVWNESAQSYVAQTELQLSIQFLNGLLDHPALNGNSPSAEAPVPNAEAVRLSKFFPGMGGFNMQLDPAGRLSRTRITKMKAQLSGAEDEQASGDVWSGRHWPSVAHVLDVSAANIRTAYKRNPSKIPFANIEVVQSNAPIRYTNPQYWITALVTQWIQVGCCTVLSFRQAKSGHQIAVNRLQTDKNILFDPNYGVYRFSLLNLERCFKHLFWQAQVDVHDMTTLSPHAAVYCRPDIPGTQPSAPCIEVGYTIFKKI
jgi:hypothetical protein